MLFATTSLYRHHSLQGGAFWGYLLTILVTISLAFILGGVSNANLERNRGPFSLPRNWAALIWILALAFLVVGIYYGTFCIDLLTAGALNLLLILQLIFFVAWFVTYYRFGDFTSAFWGGLILILLALATLFFLWQAGAFQSSILVIIYLAWLLYEVVILYYSTKH